VPLATERTAAFHALDGCYRLGPSDRVVVPLRIAVHIIIHSNGIPIGEQRVLCIESFLPDLVFQEVIFANHTVAPAGDTWADNHGLIRIRSTG
jgi:hypothetical protein